MDVRVALALGLTYGDLLSPQRGSSEPCARAGRAGFAIANGG